MDEILFLAKRSELLDNRFESRSCILFLCDVNLKCGHPSKQNPGSSRRRFLKGIAAIGSLCSANISVQEALAASKASLVRVRPREYTSAFANPLKGFRPDIPSDGGQGAGLDNPLVTLVRHYIRWNQIENSASDGIEKIFEFCNPKWTGMDKRNIKIIPRVYLYWPDKYYWPPDLRAGDYGSRKFLHRLEKFIHKLGAAWNRDGRVAYIETGIVGPCGEQWGPSPHAELKRVLGDSYAAAFPDKLCMIRYPWDWPDHKFGVFWDSWGTHKDTARMLEVLESASLSNSWKTRVRGGEISYGFGEPPGESPDDTMAKSHHIDWIECLIRRGHWNHLGWVSYYDWKRPTAAANGERLQKAFGYRFVIDEVSYPSTVQSGEKLRINFTVRNTGSSPFYYDWPVAVCLLTEDTHECIWQETFPGVDIRKWLPGDRWMQFAEWDTARGHYLLDNQSARYESSPEPYQACGYFTLPRHIRRGQYILALAILDPSNMKPCCRFAVENYFSGGLHSIGRIGVGRDVLDADLDRKSFADLAGDATLGYAP